MPGAGVFDVFFGRSPGRVAGGLVRSALLRKGCDATLPHGNFGKRQTAWPVRFCLCMRSVCAVYMSSMKIHVIAKHSSNLIRCESSRWFFIA